MKAVGLPHMAECIMSMKERLVARAEAHCEERGISLARLATIVANDGKFFARLERGGTCGLPMYERFERYFADPDGFLRERAEKKGAA